ncbi:p-loop containing nucleoside triphosphate hydrolase protein [Mycena venus]|uniref:p-loop containing nucleoside triphosphate hydrolase protein n=1 Tax=Mycena venus TaxID=2733690 RepID=A0A8H6XY61_9AGAR|nr:p-loop containing nucleoside triphosphate hydrolase protein [Mycena venus]
MPPASSSIPHLLRSLLRLLCSSSKHASRFVKYILRHPQAGELIRFLFLGTVMETARSLTQKIPQYVNIFMVKAHFQRGNATFDWVSSYLDHHQVWNQSRTFNVTAKDTDKIKDRDLRFKSGDGYLDAVYEPASWALSTDLFHWKKKHWITVSVDKSGLTLSVWSLNQSVLDDFIQEAREFYLQRPVPPPVISAPPVISPPTGSPPGFVGEWLGSLLVTGIFDSGDFSFIWILEYLQSQDIMADIMQFHISTRQADAGWSPQGKKETVHALPLRPNSIHRFRWRSHWVQANLYSGGPSGPQIAILIHSCDKTVLLDFIEAARLQYKEASISRVNVHLTTGHANWGRMVSKNRRSFSTLILPDGIKETLLADMKEFLENEEWYTFAGVPHRRGYLLYGDPGTGKSTTVHALAGELGMEIYFVSLASPGVNNFSLGELFHSTPPHSILLIEDIDCAFPTRVNPSDEVQTQTDEEGRPIEILQPRSKVTLAGLLNILDSVASQEGRILIATTNHIEQLDPGTVTSLRSDFAPTHIITTALIRPGRIDMKIKYSLAMGEQLENVFNRFYPVNNDAANPPGIKSGLTVSEIEGLARQFAAAVPHSKYSIAQLQGYLLGWKNDPKGAVQGIPSWIAQQEIEAMQSAKHGRQWFLSNMQGGISDGSDY